jgi:hypothetical protein
MVKDNQPEERAKKASTRHKYRQQKPRNKKPKDHQTISPEALERLQSVVNLERIQTDGFDKSMWLSLSYEDKCLLPHYISMEHRKSSTAAEKKDHIKHKKIISSIVSRFKKYAMQKFYMKNKKEVKQLKEDAKISSNQAILLLWDRLDDIAKNAWYETYCDVPDKAQPSDTADDCADQEV